MSEPRGWRAEIGMDALVIRPDGSYINFGDAIYHPKNVAEARAYAERCALSVDDTKEGPDVERLVMAMRRAGFVNVTTDAGFRAAAERIAAEYAHLGTKP